MGIVLESGEDSIFAQRQVALDAVKTNKLGIDQTFFVSTLDIVEQFRRVEVSAIGHKLIPDVGPLSRQLAPEQAREVGHDFIAALLSNGYQRHKAAQSRTSRPFIGILILDYRLNPSYVAATYRRQHLAEVFRDEVAAERIEEVARKRCKADHKRIGASLAEL